MINPGDVIVTSISDPPQGFTAVVRDLTTHQTGFMTASAANGFMNTDIADCSGTPFTFHAEYSSAKQQNQVPWAALEGGVLMQQEIGHGEVCNSVTNNDPSPSIPRTARGYSDPKVYDTCVGGAEGPSATGEGSCTGDRLPERDDPGPERPGGLSDNNPASGALCEFADGYCFKQGTRTAFINGVAGHGDIAGQRVLTATGSRTVTWTTTASLTCRAPGRTAARTTRPRSSTSGRSPTGGHTYPLVQFETDVAGSENLCNTATGVGLHRPADQRQVLSVLVAEPAVRRDRVATRPACVWNFGNDQPNTVAGLREERPVRHS